MTFIRLISLCFILSLAGLQPAQADNLADLLQQSQDHLALGHYREAQIQLQDAENQALQQQDDYHLTLVKALQGYLALQQQDSVLAEQLLSIALKTAEEKSWNDLIARIDLYLGQLYQRQQDTDQAKDYFQHAVSDTAKVTDKSLLVSAYYQLAKLAMTGNHKNQAHQYLQQASRLLESLPISAVGSQLWLNIGYQNLQLFQLAPDNSDYLKSAYQSLTKALEQARQFKQLRSQASALEHLASLYTLQKQPDAAVKLLEESIFLAQQDDAQDILINLEWQLGRIYTSQHKLPLAVAAYRRAVKHIEAIRIDIPVSYQKGRSSFRDTLAPIYLGLADLLLQQSAATPAAQPRQGLLKEAQDTVELMKKSEFEDYFQSRCDISATPINLQKTDPTAAAIYPVQLPDRLELIVYTASGLHQFTSRVTAEELDKSARLFAKQLRSYSNFSESKQSAQWLYQWLIKPIQPLLTQQKIETLVYIPDAALRLFPLGALYDGKKFLIEDYAVVTSPGMSLIESSASQQRQQDILLAGMSIPGEVINELPDSLLVGIVDSLAAESQENRQLFQNQPTRDLNRWLQRGNKRTLSAAEQQQKTRALRELLQKRDVVEKLQQAFALPGVDTEIKQLAEQNQTSYILNDSFSLANFSTTLTEHPHTILHIASHGFFGSTAEDSFIMTYDKILNINNLQNLLGMEYFKLHPLDLITLSACQTAEGDDRSPLGLSGVAIKSKVHSALGSLWPVADEATAQLMTSFYQSLKKPHQTKAKALQEAMQELLKQKKFENPSFWSPFILIGNWI